MKIIQWFGLVFFTVICAPWVFLIPYGLCSYFLWPPGLFTTILIAILAVFGTAAIVAEKLGLVPSESI